MKTKKRKAEKTSGANIVLAVALPNGEQLKRYQSYISINIILIEIGPTKKIYKSAKDSII